MSEIFSSKWQNLMETKYIYFYKHFLKTNQVDILKILHKMKRVQFNELINQHRNEKIKIKNSITCKLAWEYKNYIYVIESKNMMQLKVKTRNIITNAP